MGGATTPAEIMEASPIELSEDSCEDAAPGGLSFGEGSQFLGTFTTTADGGHLTIRVAPDNGDEANGTEILTYDASVTG